MLPTSCLVAILAALSVSSALTIPQPPKHHAPAAAFHEIDVNPHPSLRLSNTPSDFSEYAVLEDGFAPDVLAEMEAHMKDYKGWDLDEMRLISIQRPGETEEEVKWVTEYDKIILKTKGWKFMDITDSPTLGMANMLSPGGGAKKLYTYPQPSSNSSTHAYTTSHFYPKLSTDIMKANLIKFSGFRTRYYRSETGKQSQQWLLSKIKEYAQSNPHITIKEHAHSWGQNSIVARIPTAHETKLKTSKNKDGEKKKKDSVVIIGAHQDSANMWPFLPAPGADDDGSGTTSILDAFRVLAASHYKPTNSAVEFHWYSAEEGGLLGSQAVAKVYEEDKVDVKGMIQMDMTAWVKKDTKEVIGVITDFVDPALTEFIAAAVHEYCDIPAVSTKCGYACSDHASWSKAGYQSAFSIESTFEDSNHAIHSSGDTIEHPEFSFDHMQQFSKLAIAFAVELGGLEVPKK
ncbi:hypothetical protein QFC22_006069 [Naganishia vaughanmartiniae]|uniref:Uncharacterized protein n=1 Tax=Naganishia vaughanmartiniae TaxID=1424756 RepID=A0ACC2WN97_9TREE|nr:hypothetical protein QFC22_006069 [Naganishia vaughanmartiniae]